LAQKLLRFCQCVLPRLWRCSLRPAGETAVISFSDAVKLHQDFLKKHALEQAIQLVGEEVHRQYILTFEPKGGEPGKFHAVRVEVKNRPELQAKTREGYWALE
jgi:hypothetical protein